jgi:hypothetical protein
MEPTLNTPDAPKKSSAGQVLNLYKKLGETPRERLERLRTQKPHYAHEVLSYAGRLDPMAEGVLLCLVGSANKRREAYLDLGKEYVLDILFGFSTDTYDVLGRVMETGDKAQRKTGVVRMRRKVMGGLLLGGLIWLGLNLPAHALTFAFDIDHCLTCGPPPFGTVTLLQAGSNVTVDVDVRPNELSRAEGLRTFSYNLTQASATATGATSGFNVLANGPFVFDTFGTFNHSINCGVGAAFECLGHLAFTVNNVTLASFIPSVGGSPSVYFGAYIEGANTEFTGPVGASVAVPGPVIGAGLPGLMAACGALLMMARRRRSRLA